MPFEGSDPRCKINKIATIDKKSGRKCIIKYCRPTTTNQSQFCSQDSQEPLPLSYTYTHRNGQVNSSLGVVLGRSRRLHLERSGIGELADGTRGLYVILRMRHSLFQGGLKQSGHFLRYFAHVDVRALRRVASSGPNWHIPSRVVRIIRLHILYRQVHVLRETGGGRGV